MPETPPLFFFVQDDNTRQIYFNFKSDQTGLVRWKIPKWKAADLNAELARMVSVGVRG